MKNKSYFSFFLLLAIICLSSFAGFAQEKDERKMKQKEFCSGNWSGDGKVSFHEAREMTVSPTSLLTVDGKRNGGIRVVGENRNDILVRACVQTWAETEEAAQALARNIRIQTGSLITADMPEEFKGSVSYEIHVPRMTNLKLMAHNGGISISSVEGALEFETKNGGVSLSDVAGDVKGRTTN